MFKTQLQDLGVKIVYNSQVDRALIEQEQPDAVIIATGAKPIKPPIKGADLPNVVQAFDVLAGKKDVGNRVAIIGGGLVGTETADHLAIHGKQVVLVEMQKAIAQDGFAFNNLYLFESLNKHRVEIVASAKVLEITPDAIIYEKDGTQGKIENLDSVILAIGASSVDTLSQDIEESGVQVKVVGDASEVRQGIDAITEAYATALLI